MRKISKIGNEMLAFQEKMAKKYKYQPIPIDLFHGNIRDKYQDNLPEWCQLNGENICLYTTNDTMICTGYERIVVGDYGAFLEISPDNMCINHIMCKPGQEYRITDKRYARNVKYIWMTACDVSNCKIYLQKKTVDYADYREGMYYISPYEVFP